MWMREYQNFSFSNSFNVLFPFKIPYPDIAEADGISVILQKECESIGMFSIGKSFVIFGVCGAGELDMIVDDNSVVENRQKGRLFKLSIGIESGTGEDDIVCLPQAWGPAGIDQRWMLPVDGRGHSVGVSGVMVAIENLNFIQAHQIDTAVAPSLALTFDFGRSGPFDMELAVPELLLG